MDISPISSNFASDSDVSPLAYPERGVSPLVDPTAEVSPIGKSTERTIPSRKRNLFPSTPRSPKGQLNPVGRKPLYKKHPQIIEITQTKLLDHGFAAHARRNETWASVGVSAKTLRQDLAKEVDGLDSISESTVRSLFAPPNKNHKNSSRYHHVIDAKIGTKHNDLSHESADSHYCRAHVKYALQMGTCFEDETFMLSADDKNKLVLGGHTPCVNRYQPFHTYFLKGDEIHTSDHNFSSGYKLIPSGYMALERKQGEPLVVLDQDGRARFNYARTGTLYITLRGNKFFRASAYNHYDDLRPIIEEAQRQGKNSVIIVCDNGPDWTKNSVKVAMCAGRLWRDLGLDYICLIAYSAGDSRFNMIEHAWAPTTSWLAGLCLSATLPGETLTPDKQAGLTTGERITKEKRVLDNAIDKVKRCIDGKEYDGFPVFVTAIQSGSKHVYDDEEAVDQLTKAQVTLIKKSEELKEKAKEYTSLCQHAVQRRYVLEFMKCENEQCEHCRTRPVESAKLMTFLRATGGCLLPPKAEPGDHFMSWRELATEAFHGSLELPELDYGLSNPYVYEGHRTCPKELCRKVFQSRADRDRHDKLVHTKFE